jgi:FKBP-type peptidyl-prolyl cis-trans isomerase
VPPGLGGSKFKHGKIKMKGWKSVLVLVSGALAGCGNAESFEPSIVNGDMAPTVEMSEMTTTASGLNFTDLAVGTGDEAVPGQRVTVHYIGWFLDGEKFDASVDRGEVFSFQLGAGGVIDGWDQGVAGMRVGGARRLVIPPELAYGPNGRSGIPPNSTLVFDVELFQVGEG